MLPLHRAPPIAVGAACIWTVLALFVLPGWAARPFDTEDTGTLDPGSAELELSLGVTKDRGATAGLGAGALNLGVVPRLEVSIEIGAIYLAREANPDQAGASDLTLGAKYRLLDETTTRPALLGNLRIRLPTGDADRGLGVPGVDVLARLAASKTFGPLTLTGNAGYLFATADRSREAWLGSVVTEYQAARAWIVGAELVAFVGARDGSWVGLARGGVVYVVTPALRLDLAVAAGLSRSSPDLVATAGITFGF